MECKENKMGTKRKHVKHGEPRMAQKKYDLAACAAACSTLTLEGGKAELFTVSTASTGCGTGANINLDISTDHVGAYWIVYDSNNACDNAAVDILVNGTAISGSNVCIAANDERLIVVNVVDVSSSPLGNVVSPADLD
jgi:hypothetical protein